MDAALKAIAEGRRREILALVRDRELSAGEIASHFDISRPAISQHVRVLVEANLLEERRDGTRRLYRLNVDGLSGARQFIEDMWDDGFVRLKAVAESAQQEKDRHGN